MNKKLIKSLLIFAAVSIAAACSVDDFNDAYLDGFEPGTSVSDVKNIEYTLAEGDYSTISGNATNKALAGEEGAAVLAAIGSNKYFSAAEDAQKYIPAFLASKYNVADNNSIALIGYKVAVDMPDELAAMNAMKSYTLTTDDYKTVWGSDEDYTEALTPATAGKLASVISSEGIEAGDYVAVTYKYSASEPNFNKGGDEGEEPADGYTSVLGTAALNDTVEVKGYVVADAGANGIVVADNGGAILLYQTTGFEIGDEVTVKGTISSYNTGFQMAKAATTITKTGTTTVKYPEPLDLTGAKMDEILVRKDNAYQIFVKVTNAKVSVSGNYYNFKVDGATAAQGSFYGLTDAFKAQLKDSDVVSFYGYLSSISSAKDATGTYVPTYVNIILTHIGTAPATAAYAAPATRAVAVTSEQKYAVYKYNGSSFAKADVAVVQPTDYKAMGQNYDNLTDPDQNKYLPKYLTQAYPYASADETVYVSFILRKNSANNWATDEYTFNGTEWVKNDYFTTKFDQFRKDSGSWRHDPTLEINFLTDGTSEFKAFLQYCANWVYDNIDVAVFGAPERDNAGEILSTDVITVNGEKPAGSYFVSSYGNNEWFAGTYAYYGEMNWRHDQARTPYENVIAAIKERGLDFEIGIDDLDAELTDEMIVKAMQKNAITVFENVLHYMYPTATSKDYSRVVLNVYNYFNSDYAKRAVYTYSFEIVGTGEFKYIEDSFGLL